MSHFFNKLNQLFQFRFRGCDEADHHLSAITRMSGLIQRCRVKTSQIFSQSEAVFLNRPLILHRKAKAIVVSSEFNR